jgi:hypothetical protein
LVRPTKQKNKADYVTAFEEVYKELSREGKMKFLLGLVVGYNLRGKDKPLIIGLASVAYILYIILTCVALPAVALLALCLDVQHERQSRPAQTRVPSLKGLSVEEAQTKLHSSDLNIRLLATRYDLPIQPGLIIDQVPQPGEEVVYGYPVGVTITEADSYDLGR